MTKNNQYLLLNAFYQPYAPQANFLAHAPQTRLVFQTIGFPLKSRNKHRVLINLGGAGLRLARNGVPNSELRVFFQTEKKYF